MRKLSQITDAVLGYHPQADADIILNAYMYSAKAHRGQSRTSGEAYLSHPMEVAYNLTRLRMDEFTVAAGLLHDTIEDTLATPDEIRSLFGDEIYRLVDGVTKIGQITFSSKEEKQAENYRKMILAMAQDIRVVLIKLADRAHNLQTLEALPVEKQRRIARETLDIFAPIANRLGIGWLKSELENHSFKFLYPEKYKEIERRVQHGEQERQEYVQGCCETLCRELDSVDIKCKVVGRPKLYYSIFQKMVNQNIEFEQVYDLVGLRVITENIKECYAVLGLVHALWRPIPGKFKDYIAMPKPNRYQSLHTTVSGPRGQRVEVQIRTQEMEQIAENGIAAHWQYKEVGASKASHMEDHLSWIRRMLEDQKDIKDPRAFLDSFKVDLYFQEVFVFTPQGDVIAMQQGATPVDMAYQVHTDIGHHCAGAKVNGKQAPLRYKLKNGDQVEIITSKHKHPSRDWLSFVKTSKARYKISNFLNQRQKERSLSLGKDLLEKEIRKFGLEPAQVLKGTQLDEAIHACGFNSLDTLQVSIGYGKTSVRRALEKLIPRDLLREQEDKAVEIKAPSTSPKDPIKVRDFDDDILIRMGKCCAPLPGDPITGYITRGRGISVHHTACPSVAAFTLEAERLVDVVWDTPEKATFATRIAVVTADRPGQLARISNAFAECDVNITRADVRLGPQKKAYFDLTVEIRNLEHLTKTLHKVRQVGGVLNVERIQNFRKPRKEKGELGEGQGPSTESEQPGLLIN